MINLPPEFKKNGISVQGDEIAEIVYFTIDRYFDAVDLFDDSVAIVIQWENAPDKDTKEVLKGVSKIWVKDVNSLADQGKIIFGWALNSTITKNPGTIKFAVRFYTVQDDVVVFNMSTLPQTATINPSLNFDLNKEAVYDDIQTIRNRLINSTSTVIDPNLEGPVFDLDIPPVDKRDNPVEIEFESADGSKYTVNGYMVDLDESGELVMTAQAHPKADGVVSYEWTRRRLDRDNADSLEAKEVYVVTSDTAASVDKVYYTQKSGEPLPAYTPYSATAGEAFVEGQATLENGDNVTIYEKISTYTAVATGDYHVVGITRKGVAQAQTAGGYVRVPGPGALSLEGESKTEQIYFNGSHVVEVNSDLSEVTINGEKQTVVNGKFTYGGKTYDIHTDRVVLDATSVGVRDIVAEASTPNAGDTLTYTWTKASVAEGEERVESHKVGDEDFTDTLSITGVSEEARLTFDEIYTVSVIASRNKDKTEALTKEYRLTDVAHVPNVTIEFVDADQKEFVDNTHPATLKATVSQTLLGTDKDILSDEYSYQWYKYIFDDPTENPESADHPYANDTLIAEATEATYTTGIPGTYYCVVGNKVNGSVAYWRPTNIEQMINLKSRQG